MTTSLFSLLPSGIGVYFAVFLLALIGILFYALCTKGDVRAEVSHGRTVFKLEAKERKSNRK